MIQAVIFDLDDTLYRESDFVLSGYRAVARHISRIHGRDYGQVYEAMATTFWTEGRRQVLPMLRDRYLDSSVSIAELVEVYRGHEPDIQLLPGYDSLLRDLRRRYRTGIITDGLPEVQRRKTRALGLDGAVDDIIYTWDYGSAKEKPHPHSFLLMMSCLGTDPRRTVFLGDDYLKDCRGARKVGMEAIRLTKPPPGGSAPCREGACPAEPDVFGADAHRAAGLENPDRKGITIDSLFQLAEVLDSLSRKASLKAGTSGRKPSRSGRRYGEPVGGPIDS